VYIQAVVNKDNTAILLQQQQQHQQIVPSQPVREDVVVGSRDTSGRGDAEDQSQSFLRKKEEELRQKRELERQLAEARSKQAADTTYTVSPPSGVKAGAAQAPGVVSKLEFVAVTTVTSPTTAVSSSLISAPVRTTAPATTTASTTKTPQTVTAVTTPPVVATTSYQPVRPLPGAGANIPQFYFPLGSPAPSTVDLEDAAAKLHEEFDKLDDGKATKNTLGPVMKVRLHFSM